jgi:hypothetical protein
MSEPEKTEIAGIEIEMLSQPLTTDEGFLNPAALSELEAKIASIPKTYLRLADDPEWAAKRYTCRREITGAFAKWAVRQSPYGCPDGLESVVRYLDACLKTAVAWDGLGFAELSLCDINRVCWDILGDFAPFQAWNRAKEGSEEGGEETGEEVVFVSAFDLPPDPDHDFIDLDALLCNVCIDIRTKRRVDDEFDRKFEAEHGAAGGTSS